MRCALCLELVDLPLARQVESKRVASITKDSLRARIGFYVRYGGNVISE